NNAGKPCNIKGTLERRTCRGSVGAFSRHLFYKHSFRRLQAAPIDAFPGLAFRDIPQFPVGESNNE
ncbi:hypothetical protein ACQRCJ_11805, partial [Desulfovibrio sp. SGI.102]|uniref:hypothetical protein n=1 Tax=Desulfovibrio sp. SGI.102 TaxID=3420559 RepID=UPI003CFC5D5B